MATCNPSYRLYFIVHKSSSPLFYIMPYTLFLRQYIFLLVSSLRLYQHYNLYFILFHISKPSSQLTYIICFNITSYIHIMSLHSSSFFSLVITTTFYLYFTSLNHHHNSHILFASINPVTALPLFIIIIFILMAIFRL